MEPAVIILIAITSIALLAAAVSGFALYGVYRRLTRENAVLTGLPDIFADYRIDWDSELKEIRFGESTLQLLEQCGLAADKEVLKNIFSSPGCVEESGFSVLSLATNALKKGGVVSRIPYPDGGFSLIRWKSVAFPSKNGTSHIVTLGSDISEATASRGVMDCFRERYKEVSDFQELLQKYIGISDFLLLEENDQITVHLSQEMAKELGLSHQDKIPLEEFSTHISPQQEDDFIRNTNRLISGVTDMVEMRLDVKNARSLYRTYLIRCRAVTDQLYGWIGAMVDITDVTGSKGLENDRLRDTQTGLLNREGFTCYGAEYLKSAKAGNKPCCVICIQIARLQKVGTLFGIDVADTLTKVYAQALLQLAGEDGVVGKVGAEDFAVLLGCGKRSQVEYFLKEISIVVENNCNNTVLPSVLKEQSGFLAGACFYDGADDITVLYSKASVTLFSSSRITGNVCCYFDAGVEEKFINRDIIEQEIGDAIRRGELELYYQPKMDLYTERIIGAEALMRWNHPTLGLVQPVDFIPVAEEMGLITKIDEWGLTQACVQMKLWQDKGYPPIRVSVNMSQAQLYQTDVVETIRTALDETGLDPRWLVVELTETMAMLDIERTTSVLARIKELGVDISMDDFGTGYSSLSSVKTLPIDQLKIDRSLIYDIETNETARKVTKAIMELGKAMDMSLLAEGVETVGQRDLLRSMGCQVAQGFLYGRPEPAAVIEKEFLMPMMENEG